MLTRAVTSLGIGPRNCIGERLALTELRVTLALLLTHFQFEVAPGSSEPFQALLMSLQPWGISLKVTELSD